MNEIKKSSRVYITAYTEDKELMQMIKRSTTRNEWLVIKEYSTESGTIQGVKYEIPKEQLEFAERTFKTKINGSVIK